jgi:ATP-dependent exoDNAse (exonuclease V) beta subunit
MTIHKAKGLEARVVILADAAAELSNAGPRRFYARLVRVPPGELVGLLGPRFKNGAAIAASLDATRHDEAEYIRLLYVALTRARDRVFVFAGGKGRGAWIEALATWNAGVTHRALEPAPRRARATAPAPVGAPEAVARYEAAIAAATASGAPPFQSPSAEVDHVGSTPGALPPELAREVGSIVHARLAGFPVTATGDARNEAEALLRAFHDSPLGARLASLDVLGREIPLLLGEDAARWRGAIDLLYRDGDGALVVADYKTDASDDGAIDRHREQLGVYVRAVRRALPDARVRAELWMLRTGHVLEIA